MKHLSFEMLKHWRNKTIFLVICSAIILSLANMIFLNAQIGQNTNEQNDLNFYASDLYQAVIPYGSIAVDQFGEPILTEAQERVNTFLVPVEDETNSDIVAYIPSTSYPFFQAVADAVVEDDIVLSEQLEADLKYALIASEHQYHQIEANPNYQSTGSVTYIKKGSTILFGILSLLLFFIIAIRIHSEDYERGSLVFNWTLPKSRQQIIIMRWISVIILAIIYVLLILTAISMFSMISGDGLGDWLYPNRVMSENPSVMTNLELIVRMIGVWLLRVGVVSALGLLVANIIRLRNVGTIMGSFFIMLIYFFTNYLPSLQEPWNILYFNYIDQLIGGRYLDLSVTEQGQTIIGVQFISPTSLVMPLLIKLSLIILFLFLANQWNELGTFDGFLSNNDQQPTPFYQTKWYGVGFEWQKLQQIIDNKTSMTLIVLFTIGLYLLLVFNDRPLLDETINPSSVSSYENIVTYNQVFLDDISNMSKEEQEFMRFVQDDLTLQNDYYQNAINQLNNRSAAYQTNNSHDFYDNFNFEVDEFFGKGDQMDMIGRSGESIYLNGEYASNFAYEVSLDRLTELKIRDIKPIPQTHIHRTIYDPLKNPTDNFVENLKYQPADHSFLTSLYRLFFYYRLDVILLIILLLASGAGFTIDREKGNGLSWMFTLPRKRRKVYNDKIMAGVLRIITLLALFIAIVFILGMLTDGFGQTRFPILHYDYLAEHAQNGTGFEESYSWMNLGTFIIQSISILLLISLFLLILANVLSLWIKQPLLLFSIVGLLMVGGYSFIHIPALNGIIRFTPFPYIDIMGFLTGEIAVQNNLASMDYMMGAIVLLAWSLVLYLFGVNRSEKMSNVIS
ncbi:ABC transporter permease [Fundicoccus culcitae]|uniref:ABC transporter permease subunit n=1 Tax=Fundicoccus culcitae TaxID=2969821 RepID=A0ABY5P6K2_9LACT|nr:ABC-2 transporter permease [Fundicoccus culcitae]UUX34372.1 ABC transporter permease subunit [Fundicoccus culcitae]